jgi:hypothetical protein
LLRVVPGVAISCLLPRLRLGVVVGHRELFDWDAARLRNTAMEAIRALAELPGRGRDGSEKSSISPTHLTARECRVLGYFLAARDVRS